MFNIFEQTCEQSCKFMYRVREHKSYMQEQGPEISPKFSKKIVAQRTIEIKTS